MAQFNYFNKEACKYSVHFYNQKHGFFFIIKHAILQSLQLNYSYLFCLFGLRLYVPVNNFTIMLRRFPGLNQY